MHRIKKYGKNIPKIHCRIQISVLSVLEIKEFVSVFSFTSNKYSISSEVATAVITETLIFQTVTIQSCIWITVFQNREINWQIQSIILSEPIHKTISIYSD
jgi:hypothetical protein